MAMSGPPGGPNPAGEPREPWPDGGRYEPYSNPSDPFGIAAAWGSVPQPPEQQQPTPPYGQPEGQQQPTPPYAQPQPQPQPPYAQPQPPYPQPAQREYPQQPQFFAQPTLNGEPPVPARPDAHTRPMAVDQPTQQLYPLRQPQPTQYAQPPLNAQQQDGPEAQDTWGSPAAQDTWGSPAAQDTWGSPATPERPGARRSRLVFAMVAGLVVVVAGAVGTGVYLASHQDTTSDTFRSTPAAQPVPASASAQDQPTPSASAGDGTDAGNDAIIAQPGDCLINDGTNEAPKLRKVDCAKDTFEVLKRFPGTVDKTKCDGVPGYTHNYFFDSSVDSEDFVLCLKQRK